MFIHNFLRNFFTEVLAQAWFSLLKLNWLAAILLFFASVTLIAFPWHVHPNKQLHKFGILGVLTCACLATGLEYTRIGGRNVRASLKLLANDLHSYMTSATVTTVGYWDVAPNGVLCRMTFATLVGWQPFCEVLAPIWKLKDVHLTTGSRILSECGCASWKTAQEYSGAGSGTHNLFQ